MKKAWRDKSYLKWVKSLDCCNCGSPADDAHHIISAGLGGMGTKAPDWATMPLCRGCHTSMHNNVELIRHQQNWLNRTLDTAFREGRLS